jgi:TolB-like protein/Flp pilus assembly protein TadD
MLYFVRGESDMDDVEHVSPPIRFGIFEVDSQSGELRRSGLKIKLQEQPFQVLMMLLERAGKVVTREQLQKRLWPADTFVDFDRGLNRAINRLRDALGDDSNNPRFIETLPLRGYRFIVPVETQPASRSVRSPEGSHPRAHLIESLAVLPLENLSNDSAQEYFADGMTDELITELAKITSLRLISRASIMQYKGTRKPLPLIARELGVDAVVEGTIVRSGQTVRITAKLVQACDDRHLWSEKYERALGDVLTLQGEVAQAIADQIQVKLTSKEHASLAHIRSINPQAHEAYFKGSFFRNKWTEEGLDKSIQYLSEAIELEPAYAQGYAGLSLSYCALGIFGIRPAREVYPKARAAAMRALDLNETVAEAHISLADVKKGYDWDWPGAEAEYKRALNLNPSYAIGHMWYADYLSKMGRHPDAIAEATRARELDPISVDSNAFLGFILYRARRYDEALKACQKGVELDPYHPEGHWFVALAHEQRRELAEAIAELQKAVSFSGGGAPYLALLGRAYALAGERTKASSILDELRTLSDKKYVSPLDFAVVYTGLGDRNSAFHWLEKACQERTMRIQELPQPIFDSLRSDPRYHDLMRRIGLSL